VCGCCGCVPLLWLRSAVVAACGCGGCVQLLRLYV